MVSVAAGLCLRDWEKRQAGGVGRAVSERGLCISGEAGAPWGPGHPTQALEIHGCGAYFMQTCLVFSIAGGGLGDHLSSPLT